MLDIKLLVISYSCNTYKKILQSCSHVQTELSFIPVITELTGCKFFLFIPVNTELTGCKFFLLAKTLVFSLT